MMCVNYFYLLWLNLWALISSGLRLNLFGHHLVWHWEWWTEYQKLPWDTKYPQLERGAKILQLDTMLNPKQDLKNQIITHFFCLLFLAHFLFNISLTHNFCTLFLLTILVHTNFFYSQFLRTNYCYSQFFTH